MLIYQAAKGGSVSQNDPLNCRTSAEVAIALNLVDRRRIPAQEETLKEITSIAGEAADQLEDEDESQSSTLCKDIE